MSTSPTVIASTGIVVYGVRRSLRSSSFVYLRCLPESSSTIVIGEHIYLVRVIFGVIVIVMWLAIGEDGTFPKHYEYFDCISETPTHSSPPPPVKLRSVSGEENSVGHYAENVLTNVHETNLVHCISNPPTSHRSLTLCSRVFPRQTRSLWFQPFLKFIELGLTFTHNKGATSRPAMIFIVCAELALVFALVRSRDELKLP
ncbi:hypothetical protein RHMOL_Rhmol10G0253900 [Rhododendron molle]|uniref:Uncharacterized protein n=1 Tax=Rhododendron molle TaxID=49168 RepID=A0ACC0M7B4_RHOML|nr:hypothetical protein RHMOL_Rhmol10G0253900 [Rhododendron molle]